jgi:predicted RNA-binding Zn-ribbon protein involved in translation (DUF1610 family)
MTTLTVEKKRPRKKRSQPKRNQREKKRKSGRIAHDSCSVCGRAIGGLSGLTTWKCPRCRKLFCRDCCPVSSAPKKLVCPECGTEFQSVERKKSSRYPVFLSQNSKPLKGAWPRSKKVPRIRKDGLGAEEVPLHGSA